MPVINIIGFNYEGHQATTATLNLQLSWYIFDNKFHISTISSAGGTAPPIWLSNENGKVVIFVDQKVYFQRFTINAFAQGIGEKPEYFKGWTVVDEALSGTNQVKVPYKNVFGDKVGIGTNTPNYTLDVNGDINTTSLIVNNIFNQNNLAENSLKSVLARISEGNNTGEGTFLGVRTFFSQKHGGVNSLSNVKTFSLEHNFYGKLNNSINFYRGESYTGGHIGIAVYDGVEYFKLSKGLLEVDGTIRTKEVKVEADNWADFVFDKDYKLPSLDEVKAHIDEHKHLPNIPSEKEVQENGIGIGEMQAKLLQKIEELTLYVIQQDKAAREQNKKIEKIEKENILLKTQIIDLISKIQ